MCGRYAITMPPEAVREWFVVIVAATLSLPVLVAGMATAASSRVPEPEHIVVVVLENHSFSEILGTGEAPFLDYLATRGAKFTRSFAVAHPSQPNYFALFSGSTQGVRDNGPYSLAAPTLAGSLQTVGKSFVGYVERDSPRKHNPWESFVESEDVEQDMSKFPSDFAQLPTVSFVIPNLDHDMHDGSIAEGDAWLRQHLGPYADWSQSHNSLLIVTFDEAGRGGARIPTVFFGAAVRPGLYDEQINHYSVLRTIETMYGLPLLGDSTQATPIADVWAVHE